MTAWVGLQGRLESSDASRLLGLDELAVADLIPGQYEGTPEAEAETEGARPRVGGLSVFGRIAVASCLMLEGYWKKYLAFSAARSPCRCWRGAKHIGII